MALKDALEKLNNAIDDLTSLHVQTFTGKVTFAAGDDELTKFDNIRASIEAAETDPDIDVTLVAESLYKFDGDSYNFLTNDEGGIPASALELHKAAVEGGIKTRLGLMEMAKGVFT